MSRCAKSLVYDIRGSFGKVCAQGIRDARPEMRGRIIGRIEFLCRNPHLGKKMAGRGDLYRDKVGPHRIVYGIRDDARRISIVRICPRKDVYKGI